MSVARYLELQLIVAVGNKVLVVVGNRNNDKDGFIALGNRLGIGVAQFAVSKLRQDGY